MTKPELYSLIGKRIWVAGHRGMVGSAVVRRLAREDCTVLFVEKGEVDLRRQADVETWVMKAKPQAVILAAARVGGILANDTRPGEFLYDNLVIETNIIQASHAAKAEKLLFLGSSCTYPKMAPQPLTEESLLTGPLEPTNEWYAIAKIAGLKLCQAYRRQYGADYISAMPTNLYGPGDNYDLASSHVLPALVSKAHEAKTAGHKVMQVWGTGNVRREFLHVDDLADALVFLLTHYSGEQHVNVGTGQDLTIRELAELVCEIVSFNGELEFDSSKPNGTPRKLLNTQMMTSLGWRAQIPLAVGLRDIYRIEAARWEKHGIVEDSNSSKAQ